MSHASHDSSTIVVGLNQLELLELLEPNNYIVAIGPGSEQFTGTPNGYKA